MRAFTLLILLAGPLAGVASAQPTGDVSLPPIEIGAAFSHDIRDNGQWPADGGAGAIVGVNGNLSKFVAIAGEIADSRRMRSVAAGPRVSTGFFTEARSTGRFFAEALVGHYDSGGMAGTLVQAGVGADVIVAARGLSLHWALDYLRTPESRRDLSGARFSVGLVVGPRIKLG